jgi:hypothetical protein
MFRHVGNLKRHRIWTTRSRARRQRPEGEALEGRQLLDGSGQILLDNFGPLQSSFAGVGFALNPVTAITGRFNGRVDNTPGDYQVQVDWGDGSGFSSTGVHLTAALDDKVLVKGSHIYQTPNTSQTPNMPIGYVITVSVTGPGGVTAVGQTATAPVIPLPDAASRTPSPQVPASYSGAQPLGEVTLGFRSGNQINGQTGMEIDAVVGSTVGYYQGQVDNSLGDYHAQINWGDGPDWSGGALLPSPVDSSVLISGSHTFAQAGTYDVTIYVTGPDGQTASGTTNRIVVAQSPQPTTPTPTTPTPTTPTPTTPTPTPMPMCLMYSDTNPVETRGRLPHMHPATQLVNRFSSSEHLDASDIPALSQAVLNYARSQYGARAGGGSCADLASEAVTAAHAKQFPPHGMVNRHGKLVADPNENYVWGTNVGTFTPGSVGDVSNLLPGDILQMRHVEFERVVNRIPYTYHAEQHTAIVNAVNGTSIEILEQHTSSAVHRPPRFFVTKNVIDFSGMLQGMVWAYRPEPATP